jgi:hypothetical protein
MTELILSEITRMAPGYCVLGLEAAESGYRSRRPLPLRGNAWLDPFEFHRGDKVKCELREVENTAPHNEDVWTTGGLEKCGSVSESELLAMLQKAEVATELRGLFGCRVIIKPRGAFVIGKLGKRSICGVEARKVRVFLEAGELRTSIALPSGESLPNLPVVDRSWLLFTEAAEKMLEGANIGQRLTRYFAQKLSSAGADQDHFVRIGLTRPKPNACWLMVDTLFPFPRKSWTEEVKAY